MVIHVPCYAMLCDAMPRHATLPALWEPGEGSQWRISNEPYVSCDLQLHAMSCDAMSCNATLRRVYHEASQLRVFAAT